MRNKYTTISEKCSLVGMEPNGLTITRGGNLAYVIELQGKDYSGMDYETISAFYKVREMFFKKLAPGITVSSHTHRFLASQKGNIEKYDIPIAKEISEQWQKNFTNNYRTKHILVFSTAPNMFDSLLSVFQTNKKKALTVNLREKLKDIKNNALVRFRSYNPVVLTGDSLASYWASLVNGRFVYQKSPKNGLFDDMLYGANILFPRNKKYQIYENADKNRYSGWLIIKAPAVKSGPDLLSNLLQAQYDFSIYQTFVAFDKDKAMFFINDKFKNTGHITANNIIQIELDEVAIRVQADEISLILHGLGFEIFGDSPESLETAINEIKNHIEYYGYRVGRESINCEGLFWSRIPELEDNNIRTRNITSENAADYISMDSVGEGLRNCSWGGNITEFKTATGGVYSFTFHATPEKTALGNTIIIGGSNSGKTTLASFLISQCFQYKDFQTFLFDRYHGLEIFTRFHDGGYIDFIDDVELNPFQLEDSGIVRTFLSQFLQMLMPNFTDTKSISIIDDAIRQIMTLPKTDRNFQEISSAFGLSGEGTIRNALNKWLAGGSNGQYFTSKKDALQFNKLTTFDMTKLIDTPDVLGAMVFYIFHRIFEISRKDGGYIVFIDELANYLNSAVFVPKIEMLLQEIRKTNGVFVGAVQDAGTFLNHDISSKILNNTASYIIFSEPKAQEKHYIDGLGLNTREFDWIKQDNPRQMLLKRKSGESVILDVNLSPLNNHLKIFSSSVQDVNKMNKYRKASENWKNEYLQN
ncbi:MAG: hypothetical protein JRJ49_03505 [Deltaproteobacteria bacterium]|nr:hypothetical protein [Deltaproteobacteria bacterium]